MQENRKNLLAICILTRYSWINNFEMKFAGKRRKSTEGVTLSGAGHTGATVNGSTLWRRRMNRGPKVQHTFSYESLRQADREDILIAHIRFHFIWSFLIMYLPIPYIFIWDIFLSVHPVSGHHPFSLQDIFLWYCIALDVYIERKDRGLENNVECN